MCYSPITIDNPFFGLGSDKSYKNAKGNKIDVALSKSLMFVKNTLDSKIQVPCGHCQQCVSMRQAWMNQRVQMESLRSHLFFFTLTYNNESLVKTDIGEYCIPYPFYEDIQLMFRRLRKRGYKFRYWVCSEYGKERKRPHYHGLLALEKIDPKNPFEPLVLEKEWYSLLLSEWKRNHNKDPYTYNIYPDWKPCCDYVRKRTREGVKCTYDFHYVEPFKDHDNDVSFYVSKYILKYDERTEKLLQKIRLDPSLSDDDTIRLFSMIKPRSVMSKDFGSYKLPEVQNYISKCLQRNDKLPQYYDIYSGKSSLLSPYYRKHLLPTEWLVNKFMLYSESDLGMLISSDDTVQDFHHKSDKAKFQDLRFKKALKRCSLKY